MKTAKKQIFVHIGMPKSASTYLQTQFFPFLDNMYYVGSNKYSSDPVMQLLQQIGLYRLGKLEVFEYNEIKSKIHNFLSVIKEQNIVLSLEGLAGSRVTDKNIDNFSIFKTCLKNIFHQAKIIFITRRQDTFFESLYTQRLKKGYYYDINTFINYRNKVFCKKKSVENDMYFDIGNNNIDVFSCNYFDIYNHYAKNFGESNILVVPFELLIEDKQLFLKTISAFMGSSLLKEQLNISISKLNVNASYSKYSSQLAKMMNCIGVNMLKIILPHPKLLKKFMQYKTNGLIMFDKLLIKKGLYVKPRWLSQDMRAEILKIHRRSNKCLNDKVKFDLSKYGYF